MDDVRGLFLGMPNGTTPAAVTTNKNIIMCSFMSSGYIQKKEGGPDSWISNDFLKFIYKISIKFWIRNTLLHKFFQTDMIFFDQFKVPTIKFGKCFAEFMIPIALFKEFGS